jgi:hypothetical protein
MAMAIRTTTPTIAIMRVLLLLFGAAAPSMSIAVGAFASVPGTLPEVGAIAEAIALAT